MGVGQEQWDWRPLSSFHISQHIVDVMHIPLSRGDFFFSIWASVLLEHYKEFIRDLAAALLFE